MNSIALHRAKWLMKLISCAVGALLLGSCSPEKVEQARPDAATVATNTNTSQPAAPQAVSAGRSDAASTTATSNENIVRGTFAGQIKVGQPVSMFNYVGAESGDFAPIRFRNDSEAGKILLAACSNDDLCEFTGAVEWLDEAPPPDASAIGRIVSVESAKRLPSAAP